MAVTFARDPGWCEAGEGAKMATYVMLTRLTPETAKTPGEMKRLERAVADHIRKDCPQVKWIANYAIRGPCDYMDVFDGPGEMAAAQVARSSRPIGHAYTETWTAELGALRTDHPSLKECAGSSRHRPP
jgi:uncharacterized protein with GYD domain